MTTKNQPKMVELTDPELRLLINTLNGYGDLKRKQLRAKLFDHLDPTASPNLRALIVGEGPDADAPR